MDMWSLRGGMHACRFKVTWKQGENGDWWVGGWSRKCSATVGHMEGFAEVTCYLSAVTIWSIYRTETLYTLRTAYVVHACGHTDTHTDTDLLSQHLLSTEIHNSLRKRSHMFPVSGLFGHMVFDRVPHWVDPLGNILFQLQTLVIFHF